MTFKAILIALALIPQVPSERDTPEKRAQQTILATELARVTDRQVLIFLLAWGSHETNFAVRIHAGHCFRWECDRGRARGPWQAHRNGMSEERWAQMRGVENTRVQVEQAARHASWALRQCPGDNVRGAFRVLAGLGCSYPLKGEDARVATFEKLARAM